MRDHSVPYARTMATTAERRLLLVHAHPDDESLNNGATMAMYASAGAHVTLVTCTRGEFGEIVVPSLEHLAWDKDDALGAYREKELASAMAALGVRDHRFLGAPGEYHDSGMMGTPGNDRPDVFWQADVDEAAGRLVAIIRETRPQVLVTYDPFGGYGHPDHIQAHRVAMRAADLAAQAGYAPESGAPHAIAKIYWNVIPRSVIEQGFAELREDVEAAGFTVPSLDDFPNLVDDTQVTTEIDGAGFLDHKLAALAAHATQLTVVGAYAALSNNFGIRVPSVEYYRLVRGEPGTAGRETDLFAGIA